MLARLSPLRGLHVPLDQSAAPAGDLAIDRQRLVMTLPGAGWVDIFEPPMHHIRAATCGLGFARLERPSRVFGEERLNVRWLRVRVVPERDPPVEPLAELCRSTYGSSIKDLRATTALPGIARSLNEEAETCPST